MRVARNQSQMFGAKVRAKAQPSLATKWRRLEVDVSPATRGSGRFRNSHFQSAPLGRIPPILSALKCDRPRATKTPDARLFNALSQTQAMQLQSLLLACGLMVANFSAAEAAPVRKVVPSGATSFTSKAQHFAVWLPVKPFEAKQPQ